MAHILVVEDEPDLLEITCLQLINAGYTVERAMGGNEAFEKWRKAQFDLILTDMRMPRGSGLELLVKVRSIDKEFPVVIVTGFSTELLDTKGFNPQGILAKPVPVADLLQAIKKALNAREKTESSSKPSETHTPLNNY